MKRVWLIPILTVVFAMVSAHARADDESERAAAMTERLTIVDLQDATPFKDLESGELVRIVGATPSGGKISISFNGPGRLAWIAEIKTIKGGKVLIGELKKEFVFRRAIVGQGSITATVTCTPPVGASTTASYEFEWK